ncbi:MAG TPA: cupredoxin family copper-binding protein [Steroidobacteraceae bacterium]
MADRQQAHRSRLPISALASGVVLVSALIMGGAMPMMADARAVPKTHVIIIENMRFSPDALTVQRGERIVWINKDLFPHTATAETKAFDSGNIVSNASWAYVARKPGEYAYGCTLHPTMKAKLTVR